MNWKEQLTKGRYFLSQQELHSALNCFKIAVRDCPISSEVDLDQSLYYLGVTLKRMGKKETALRCWHLGDRLEGEGLSKGMAGQDSNFYGMVILKDTLDEDRAAFTGIQMEKYLNLKTVRRFCSDAEKDVIKDIIETYWEDLSTVMDFSNMNNESKVLFFKGQILTFPLSSSLKSNIKRDFGEKRGLDRRLPCPCGSELSYGSCCGRIKGIEELCSGEF